jgi:hypothetical protein
MQNVYINSQFESTKLLHRFTFKTFSILLLAGINYDHKSEDTMFVEPVKMSNLASDKPTVAKSEFVKLFL